PFIAVFKLSTVVSRDRLEFLQCVAKLFLRGLLTLFGSLYSGGKQVTLLHSDFLQHGVVRLLATHTTGSEQRHQQPPTSGPSPEPLPRNHHLGNHANPVPPRGSPAGLAKCIVYLKPRNGAAPNHTSPLTRSRITRFHHTRRPWHGRCFASTHGKSR